MTGVIEPIRVASDNGGQLQLQRLGAAPTSGPVVLLLHGAMSDSRVFLPAEHGLARYLAEQGCCVYVADLRGHGDSQPALGGPQPIRMSDLLQADIPALLEWLRSEHPDQRLFVVSHGWGGVWLAAALIRKPQLLASICGLVQLGVERWPVAVLPALPGVVSGGRWRLLPVGSRGASRPAQWDWAVTMRASMFTPFAWPGSAANGVILRMVSTMLAP